MVFANAFETIRGILFFAAPKQRATEYKAKKGKTLGFHYLV
jgi:hypothetical protein